MKKIVYRLYYTVMWPCKFSKIRDSESPKNRFVLFRFP